MLDSKFTIRDEFPAVDYGSWRTVVEADLNGALFDKKLVTHTYEGVDFQPIYVADDAFSDNGLQGYPRLIPSVCGSRALDTAPEGIDLRQEHANPDLETAHHAVLEDLSGGVTSLLLRLDASVCGISEPEESNVGLLVSSVDDLDALLNGVQLDHVGIAVDAGAAFLPAAAQLAALWERRKVAANKARGAFNADPLAVLAREGELPQAAEEALTFLGDLANWASNSYSGVTSVGIDTSPYHHAGATAAQDLALGLATGVAYLRAMTEAGLGIDQAVGQIQLRMSLGTRHFLAIAKLRAARRLWSRIIEVCGGSNTTRSPLIHARTSERVLTRCDPYVNMLRNSVSAFAACIGGAEIFTSLPFDQTLGLPSEMSRRVARNTVHILQEEAHLHRVIDPAGGSWFVETITEQLAEEAWGIFQEVERSGGMLRALQSGWVAEQIDSAFSSRARDIAHRKVGITGVSEFPNIGEQYLDSPRVDIEELRSAQDRNTNSPHQGAQGLEKASDVSRTNFAVRAATAGATIAQLATALGYHTSPTQIEPLKSQSLAKPFEELRDATNRWQSEHGQRPRVFLANMGPIAHHTARATYAKNFFEAGGFEVVSNHGFELNVAAAIDAYRASGASIVVICSSDKLYPDFVPRISGELKAAGVRTVVLAGNPGAMKSAWRDAGVDRFIHMKCNVLATLQELLQEEGVLTT